MPMSPIRHSFLLLMFFAAPALSQSRAAADDPFRTERAEFMRAYASVENGTDTNAATSDALRAYPLFPYLEAARLRRSTMGR